jgi:site-specific DNA-cytosine methylase
MKHLGDITKIKGSEVPLVDIVCGGSPCQDLSVAGKRAGLDGERSGLFMEQIRIIKEMRNESIRQLQMRGAVIDIRCIQPRFMVWENVPGAFSSNKGGDFRAVLEETARIVDQNAVIPGLEGGAKWTPSGCIMGNGWSIAWRVHDAQFWGVPQRRKRIALVADFGGSTAPEILFERKSVSGNPQKSRTERQDTSLPIKERTGDTVYCLQGNGIDRADTAGCNGKGWRENQSYTLNTIDRPAVCVSQDAYDKYSISEKAATIKQSGGIYGGGSEALCIQKVTGSLMASGYQKQGTQEAMNGMYIVQKKQDH